MHARDRSVLSTFGDVYSQASKLRDSTDKWGSAPRAVLGMSCDATAGNTADCVQQMCDGKFVLPAGAFAGQSLVVQQFSFCWGMWTMSEIDEALYAGNFVAMFVTLASSVIFMLSFRGKAAKLLTLVEDKYDAENGWSDSLTKEERLMISPSARGDGSTAPYRFGGAPYYIGVYFASVATGYAIWLGVATICSWLLIMLTSTATSTTSLSTLAASFAVILLPLITQVVVEKLAFIQTISKKRGLTHPRVWAALDMVISTTAIITGPFLILPRLLFSGVSLAWALLRLDLDVLLDERLELVDYASSASQGLWTALRLQYEFDKRQAHFMDHGGDEAFEMGNQDNQVAMEDMSKPVEEAPEEYVPEASASASASEEEASGSGSGSGSDDESGGGGLYG